MTIKKFTGYLLDDGFDVIGLTEIDVRFVAKCAKSKKSASNKRVHVAFYADDDVRVEPRVGESGNSVIISKKDLKAITKLAESL